MCSVLTQFDSNWGFTPYAGPAVAPSGALDWNPLPNVALGVFWFLSAYVVKTAHHLHCAAHLF